MESFFAWAFKGIVGIALGLGAFIMKNLHTEVVKIRDKQGELDVALEANKTALQAHKTEAETHRFEAEKRYAKEETLQSSLARIHDRIDDFGKTNDQNFKELREDIKNLIRVKA